jgi:broad specificity phosphatase PhoE
MHLILIRHGETEHNRTGVTLGRADVSLNDRGRRQARAVAASFHRSPAAMFTSPLARAADTASAISDATGTIATRDEGLIEMDVGEMEHLGHEELRSRYPDFLREWMSAPAQARMPGGETLAEVQDRAWSAIERICDSMGAPSEAGTPSRIVVVSHNFVILAIACRALGLPLDSFRSLKTSVGGRSVLDMSGAKPALISWNDTSHLRAAGLA